MVTSNGRAGVARRPDPRALAALGEITRGRNDGYLGDNALRNLEVVTTIPDLNGWVPGLEAGDADVIVEVPPSEVARLWISPRLDPPRGPDPQAAPQGPGDLSTD